MARAHRRRALRRFCALDKSAAAPPSLFVNLEEGGGGRLIERNWGQKESDLPRMLERLGRSGPLGRIDGE
jgi:hypothetical protein